MTYRTFRRRISEATASHDWLEIVTTLLGIGFLVVAALCAWGIVTAVASFGDPDPGFEAGVGFVQFTRGFAIVMFSVLGVLAFGVGWFLAGHALRGLGHVLLRRR